MKKILYCLLFVLVASIASYSQTSPKEELRGVWIASLGIDWPSARGTDQSTTNAQKNQLISILNQHKTYGLNAVFFHIRPKCDAVYKSKIDPWSQYVTGIQGAAPSDTAYDPLRLAVEEAHKRAMELHAWLNPYRVRALDEDSNTVASTNVMKKHPEWIVKCNIPSGSAAKYPYTFLNPGLPEVREYLVKVIMDIVRRYDIDGIHFDDYFYPYSSYGSFNDDASFQKYKGTFTDKALWRMNNVNMLLAAINDSIKAVKPWVKFGVSPLGDLPGNADIYCDIAGWLKGKYTDQAGVSHSGTSYIDYIMPQLYWVSYYGRLPSWTGSSFLNGRHLYIGLPSYRYTESGFTPNELGWEMKTNRSTPTVKGAVFYNSNSLTEKNYAGCTDSLRHNYYVYPAITPKMPWTPGSSRKPNAPANLRAEKNSTTGKYELKWDAPSKTSDGDTAFVYLVYRFESQPTADMLNDATKILGSNGQTFLPASYAKYSASNGDYYVVTAVDRYSNESSMSNVLKFSQPDQTPSLPAAVSPLDHAANLATSANISWQNTPLAESYMLQVAKDSLFKSIVVKQMELKQYNYPFSGMMPGQKYYWRIKAAGTGGSSNFTQAFEFESGIPLASVLSEPKHSSAEIPVLPKLKWMKNDRATSYQLQISTSSALSSNFAVDTTLTDTVVTLTRPLTAGKIYYWHVKGINSLGQGIWSVIWGFKTEAPVDVKEKDQKEQAVREYSLMQNYPNPFNPSTVIKYSLAKDGNVKLSVFDVLGKEIAVLVDTYQSAGSHSIEFNADKFNFTSGIYFYMMKTDEYVSTRKMIIVK